MKRMMSSKFDFNDFLKQWQQVNNMGGTQLMKLLPGFNKVGLHGRLACHCMAVITSCMEWHPSSCPVETMPVWWTSVRVSV